ALAFALLMQGCQCLSTAGAIFHCDNGACPQGSHCSADDWCIAEVALSDAGDLCHDAWCWEHPRPMGTVQLWSVRELAKGDVWMCGEWGNLFRTDGTRFAEIPTGTTATLNALWASSPVDVWVVGEASTLLHWNGSAVEAHDAGMPGVVFKAVAG